MQWVGEGSDVRGSTSRHGLQKTKRAAAVTNLRLRPALPRPSAWVTALAGIPVSACEPNGLPVTHRRVSPAWHTRCPSHDVVAVVPHAVAAFETHERVSEAGAPKGRDVMNFIVTRLRALMRNDSGQDLLEYALLVALIALVCVVVITSTGSGVQDIFQRISDALAGVPVP